MKKFLMMLVAVSVFGLFGAEIKWQNDMTQAAELAKKEKKPILILFTGSDWCPPCMKMAKETWSMGRTAGKSQRLESTPG